MSKKRFPVEQSLPLPKPGKKEAARDDAPGMPTSRLHYFIYSKLTGHCVSKVLPNRQKVVAACEALNDACQQERYAIGFIWMHTTSKGDKYYFDCNPVSAVKEPYFDMIQISRAYNTWNVGRQCFEGVNFNAAAAV